MKEEIQEYLNQLLCDLTVAARNIQILHWNLESKNFISLHPYLGSIYESLAAYIDQVAELQRIYYIYPQASLEQCINYSDIVIFDSSEAIEEEEAIEEALYNIENLKDITNKAITFADEKALWDIVQILSDHSVNYGKILYFLENSLEDQEEDQEEED